MTDKIDQRLAELADKLERVGDGLDKATGQPVPLLPALLAELIRSILPVAGETANVHQCTSMDIEPTAPQDDGLAERLAARADRFVHMRGSAGAGTEPYQRSDESLDRKAAASITTLKAQVAEVTRERDLAKDRFAIARRVEEEERQEAIRQLQNAQKAEAAFAAEREAREKAERELNLEQMWHTEARSTIAAQVEQIEAIREAAINLNNACDEMWNDVCRITHLDSHTRVIGSAQAQLRTALAKEREER